MKNLLLLFTLFTSFTFAQDSLKVIESMRTFSIGTKNAFIVDIPQSKMKTVAKSWKSYLKSHTHCSVDEKNSEITMIHCPIKDVLNDSVVVISTISSEGTTTKLAAAFMLDDSSFISSSNKPEIASAINYFVRQFAVEEYKNTYKELLKEEHKKEKKLVDNISLLEENVADWKDDIKNNLREIDRRKDDIKVGEAEQSIKSTAITNQKILLSTFNGTLEQRAKEDDKLKSLEKEKNKMISTNESYHSKISKLEKENRSIQKEIDKTNEESIPQAKSELVKQKAVISLLELQISNIK